LGKLGINSTGLGKITRSAQKKGHSKRVMREDGCGRRMVWKVIKGLWD